IVDADVSATAAIQGSKIVPTFTNAVTAPSINLTASSNQLVLQSGGQAGTLSWTPTAARTITFPDADGVVALESAGASWLVDGNAGTNATNNFIGTTDDVDVVMRANNIERFRLESATGDLKIGDATSGTLKATKELVLRQDGDTYGPSILRIRNRTGENGAIFETTDATITLVDFIFRTANDQRNIRYESRSSYAKTGAPSFHLGGPTPDSPTLSIGDTYAAFNNPLKIGDYESPTALLHLNAGTAIAETAPLKFTSGTNNTIPEDGAVEYDGTNYFVTSGTTRYTLAKTLTGSATLDFSILDRNSPEDLTITVNGASEGDVVSLGVPVAAQVFGGLQYTAFVSAANTVTVRAGYLPNGSVNPDPGLFKVTVFKY
ncbi:MAG: hypothetical protein WD052_05835, partial [Bacteroidales bacterium]